MHLSAYSVHSKIIDPSFNPRSTSSPAKRSTIMKVISGDRSAPEAEMSTPSSSSSAGAAVDAAAANFSMLHLPSQSLSTSHSNTTHYNPSNGPHLLVFSGGTAFNSVAGHLQTKLTTRCSHVLPVSDDGGSTAEIVRVLGGPAVGDIRSRCLRLADDNGAEAHAVRALLAHRLQHDDPEEAKLEWYRIVEGEHALWEGVSEPYKHTIRAFLVHFHANILRHSTERFDFSGGSIGNFFFAGARTFFRSLEAAIFLFSRVARIPEGSLVLPAICTEERITLAAELADGSLICGQNEISHPGCATTPCEVLKLKEETLKSPIRRIFYLSSQGEQTAHEVSPLPNPQVLTQLSSADAVIYGMGSLYTSIAPSLVLAGMGEAIAGKKCPKILILNGALDRETSQCLRHPGAMKARDIVEAVTDALNRRFASRKGWQANNVPRDYITAILVPKGGVGEIEVDREELAAVGVVDIVEVEVLEEEESGERETKGAGGVRYDPDALVASISAAVSSFYSENT